MNRPKLQINQNRIELDEAYMQMAEVWAKRSKANRLQVGALLVKDEQIISDGYNGMPSGMYGDDEVCEEYAYPPGYDGQDGIGGPPDMIVRTKTMVLHAEANAILKIAKNGGKGAEGATLYTTFSPCPECAKLIKQAKIARVVYRNNYRLPEGVQMLEFLGVKCHQLFTEKELREAQERRNEEKKTEHDWVDDRLGGGHNGEYYYTCSKCNARDWLAIYGEVGDLPKGPCPGKKKK